MGHPVFEVTKQYDAAKKQLTLFVKQTQKPDSTSAYPQTIFFKGKIDIEIDGKIETVFIKDTVENTFSFSLAHAPKLINFDYENTWIKELVFTKSFDEYVEEFQYSKDILARQAAMMELVTIVKSEDATTEQRAKIETILRNTILSNAYWRLRLGAVSQLQNLISLMQPNDATIAVLLSVIKNEKSWLKAGAIRFLGTTKNPKFTAIYLQALHDSSDRVISAAAVSLGKTKSPLAFNALAKLVSKPSMKSQSVLSALAGLKELGDKRGYKIAYNALEDLKLPRWRLPTPPVWDFRITAAETIVSLGKASAVYPMIMSRFNQSMKENDLNGIFNNLLLISILGDKRGQAAFDILKVKFKSDENTMTAINQFEAQFRNAIKKTCICLSCNVFCKKRRTKNAGL
ncbi:MAG: HEAT repeat domain-containing protein [Saprospirales bacterium]|nr:HEAT repeat domain-containing protein [Saprospirales bacterium]